VGPAFRPAKNHVHSAYPFASRPRRDILCFEMSVEPNTNTGSLPFHIARAYGVEPDRPRVPVDQARQAVEAQRTEIRRELTNSQRNIARLIAGVVPGGIDFSRETPMPTDSDAIPFYRNAPEKNAASTSIHMTGRSIDVSG